MKERVFHRIFRGFPRYTLYIIAYEVVLYHRKRPFILPPAWAQSRCISNDRDFVFALRFRQRSEIYD